MSGRPVSKLFVNQLDDFDSVYGQNSPLPIEREQPLVFQELQLKFDTTNIMLRVLNYLFRCSC